MRYPCSHRSLLAAGVLAALSPLPQPAFAEGALEEVIVSARKRDENLQQVPTAINVLAFEALQDRQIANIVDLQRASPNVTMTENSGSAGGTIQFFMRGIGNDNGFDPGVGLYIDDIFVQRPQGGLLDLYDVQRIEVLKGPQGNLYGRNTIGGAIKYITREPDAAPQAQIEARIGSYNLRQTKASLSGPLLDGALYGGVGLMIKRRDGIETNVHNGKKLWGADVQGGRGSLKFTPGDTLTIKLAVDYLHDDSAQRTPKLIAANTGTLNYLYALAKANGALAPDAPPPDLSTLDSGPDKVNSDADFDPFRLTTLTAHATVEWAPSEAVTIKSITARRKVYDTYVSEFDGSAELYLSNTQYADSDDKSQEFQFNYSGDKLDAVLGLYYLDGVQDAASRSLQGPRMNGRSFQITDTRRAPTALTSWSVYGNADYALNDTWQLSLGGRLTRERKSFFTDSSITQYAYAGANPGVPINPVVLPNSLPKEAQTWRNFSPSAKLAHRLDDDTLLYASFATGFKSGGFNNFPTNSPTLTFDPEKVKTYAVGLKTTLLDGRLRINSEAFYNDYSDKQLQYYFSDAQGRLVVATSNAGAVTTRGLETEISWLTPLDGLQFDLNVGYLDAAINQFKKQSGDQFVDVAAHTELGFSPRWTVQPRLSYTAAVFDGDQLTLSADASYRSKSYTGSPVDTSDPLAAQQVQAEHTLYNASVILKTADDHWRFALEGKNLSNRRVLTNTIALNVGSTLFVNGGYNEPRSWGLSATYSY